MLSRCLILLWSTAQSGISQLAPLCHSLNRATLRMMTAVASASSSFGAQTTIRPRGGGMPGSSTPWAGAAEPETKSNQTYLKF